MVEVAHEWVEDDEPESVVANPRKRLPRAVKPFIRVPAEWITDRAFPAQMRLLFLLIKKTREGTRTTPIAVTSALAAEAEVSPDTKNRALLHWQRAGLISVEWRGKQAPLVALRALDL
jgi:hypothetical protein